MQEPHALSNIYRLDQTYLYEKLLNYPQLLGKNSDIDGFFAEANMNNIGKFEAIRRGISQLFIKDVGAATTYQYLMKGLKVQYKKLWTTEQALQKHGLTVTEIEQLDTLRVQTLANIDVLNYSYRQFTNVANWQRAKRVKDLSVANEAVSTNNMHDYFEQSVNQVLLRLAIDSAATLSPAEEAKIGLIAASCPSIGGRAVYIARRIEGMYKAVNYNDGVLCESDKNLYLRTQRPAPNGNALYPNPTDDAVTLELATPVKGYRTQLEIHDAAGKLMLTQLLQEGQQRFSFDTNTLPNGFYFVAVLNNNSRVFTQKLVVNR